MKLTGRTHEDLNITCWKCDWEQFSSFWDRASKSQKSGARLFEQARLPYNHPFIPSPSDHLSCHPSVHLAICLMSINSFILRRHVWMYGQLVGRVGIRFVTAGAVCSSYVVSNCQNTIFVRIHTHARTHAHPSPNISRNWNFQCISCILQPVSGAKCGDNIENSKLCMHNSRRVSQL